MHNKWDFPTFDEYFTLDRFWTLDAERARSTISKQHMIWSWVPDCQGWVLKPEILFLWDQYCVKKTEMVVRGYGTNRLELVRKQEIYEKGFSRWNTYIYTEIPLLVSIVFACSR